MKTLTGVLAVMPVLLFGTFADAIAAEKAAAPGTPAVEKRNVRNFDKPVRDYFPREACKGKPEGTVVQVEGKSEKCPPPP